MYGQAGAAGSYTPADWNALTQQNMSAYTQNVMDPTLALMDRERQKQMVGEQANIIGSGAFDSSRRGVFEGESSAAYGLGRDKMVADLMRQGYNEAQAATMSQFGAQQGALGQARLAWLASARWSRDCKRQTSRGSMASSCDSMKTRIRNSVR